MATARPLAIIDELLATVDYLRISVGDPTGEAGRWVPCRPLVADPAALAALVATTRAERGTDRDDVATSLFVQGYAFRIATAAIGAWLLSGRRARRVARQRRRSPSAGVGPTASTSPCASASLDGRTVGRPPRRARRRPPRPVRRHRPPLVPGRRRPAVGQRGRVLRVVVRRRRRRPAGDVGSRSATGPRSSSPPPGPRSATAAAWSASASASPGSAAAAASGTRPSRRGSARTARCGRRPTTRPATPPCWPRPAATASPVIDLEPPGGARCPNVTPTDIPTDDPRPTSCAGRRRWCS